MYNLSAVRTSVAAALTLLFASLLVPFSAFAAAGDIDVTAATTAIAAAMAPIAAIGGAVLLVVIAIKTWKWVRRAG